MSDYLERRIDDKCDKIMREVTRISETQRGSDRRTAEAFNRIAAAIEGLTQEVRQLREDINPKALDKPKLPAPERGA
ncbi:MAG: hypothetical protein EPN97_12865 [Alphaproteobacteria bacterium]|nr:MAG: hypothetical protein EPN97_12865 [Alphaproteobacteria bacterium]